MCRVLDEPKSQAIKRQEMKILGEILGPDQCSSYEILFYEVLDIPLQELENKRYLRVVWRDHKGVPQKTYNLLLPKDAKVSTAINELGSQRQISTKIRMMEIKNNRIFQVFVPDLEVASLTSMHSIYAEVHLYILS